MANTILITGTNRGLGLEFTRQYAAAGWRVIATCRDPDNAHNLKALTNIGNIEVHALDVTDPTQIQQLAHKFVGQTIDILLNNAGVMDSKGLHFGSLTQEEWLNNFKVNSIAPILMAQAFVDAIARSECKVIANMSSIMGSIGDPAFRRNSYMYRSSKSALNAANKSLALELAALGVICVVIHPGWVKTDMGGPGAILTPQQSVAAIRKLLDTVTPALSGHFLAYDGTEVPW
ncbi:SDR family oxidoreductase [soil metagenome]